MIRIAIIQFPGSNCERETMLAVKRAKMEPVEFLWNENKEKLTEFDGYIIVGGFSYEDRSRAGIIAALDPVMLALKKESEQFGKPILGICNGAQILVETGLVPGVENNKVVMALSENKRVQDGKILGTGYYNTWIHMRLSDNYQRNAFTKYLTPREILNIPIAHGEGRFVMTNALLEEITMQGLNVFQYCDASGVIKNEFPVNPNGSIANIAAISNKQGNIMAMMPHPERTVFGDAIFNSLHDYIAEHKKIASTVPLYYYPRRDKMHSYHKEKNTVEWIVDLAITDNHALTVQTTLRQLGFKVNVKRYVHWEINLNTPSSINAIEQSGMLFNERKEARIPSSQLPQENIFLVRAKEDLLGKEKQQGLMDSFNIQDINSIQHGILWHFSGENINIAELLQTNIIHNPYSHECYQYNANV